MLEITGSRCVVIPASILLHVDWLKLKVRTLFYAQLYRKINEIIYLRFIFQIWIIQQMYSKYLVHKFLVKLKLIHCRGYLRR